MVPIATGRQMRRFSKKVAGNSPVKSSMSLGSELADASSDYGPAKFVETLNIRPEHRDCAAVRTAMEWWLTNLPMGGFELAPELRAENWLLFETFISGRLATCSRGQVIQEEGEEVKHYSIILFGQCKLRCAKPAVFVAPIVPAIDSAKDDADGREADGFINIEALGRGESLGLYPGTERSPYNVICSDKTTILRLSAQDYKATLHSFHEALFSKTVDFLEQHSVFPEVGTAQLKKIAPLLRQRRVPRGQIFIRSGDHQRHVHFLREGSCSVLVHDSPDGLAGKTPLDEEEADDNEEAEGYDHFSKMRSTSYGPQMQQAAAYAEKRNEVAKNMARGPLRKTLAGGSRPAFKVADGDMHPSATLSEPGVVMGEEALVHDNFRDWVNLRNCYSVRATKKCTLFVADITAFKVLGAYMGSGETTHMVSDKLTRRCKQFTRGRIVTQRINMRAQEIKAEEFAKLSRQKLRLPPCAGYPAVDELEDVDDYLGIVFDHRKEPPNLTHLPTLVCLEGTVYGPRHNANGPGTTAMLQAVAEDGPGAGPRWKRSSSFRDWRDSSLCDENPMGSTMPAEAVRGYADTAPSGHSQDLAIADCASPPKALMHTASLPELSGGGVHWGGVFLNTEVDFGDGMTVSLQTQTMTTSPSLPKIKNSSSLPNLPTVQALTTRPTSSPNFQSLQGRNDVCETSPKAPRTDVRSVVAKRQQKVMKSFGRVMAGKNVLVLTDKPALRKQITRVLASDGTTLVFIKSSNDLWYRLRDSKEEYHVLLLDLTKNELQVEPMLRTIRQDTRYSDLQIVVMSQEHELPDMVRSNCSFAVFLPLAASMLREALVWCFDRRSGRKLFPADEPEEEWDLIRGKAAPGFQPHALVEPAAIAVN